MTFSENFFDNFGILNIYLCLVAIGFAFPVISVSLCVLSFTPFHFGVISYHLIICNNVVFVWRIIQLFIYLLCMVCVKITACTSITHICCALVQNTKFLYVDWRAVRLFAFFVDGTKRQGEWAVAEVGTVPESPAVFLRGERSGILAEWKGRHLGQYWLWKG